MIRSYRDNNTLAVANGKTPKGFPPDLIKAARRKLVMLDNATVLDDLKSPWKQAPYSDKGPRRATCDLDQRPVPYLLSMDRCRPRGC